MRQMTICLALIIVVGCNNQSDTAPQGAAEVPNAAKSFPALEATNLNSHGLPLIMDLPKNSTFSVPGRADLEIVSGQQFQLFIANGHFDLAEVKERETGPKSFIEYLNTEIDEPNRFVVLGQNYDGKQYMIFWNVEIDGKPYRIDNRAAAWKPESKEQLDWVLKSIDSIRPAG